jgi:hypothetical protein
LVLSAVASLLLQRALSQKSLYLIGISSIQKGILVSGYYVKLLATAKPLYTTAIAISHLFFIWHGL